MGRQSLLSGWLMMMTATTTAWGQAKVFEEQMPPRALTRSDAGGLSQQSPSSGLVGSFLSPPVRRTVRDYSWIRIEEPPPREIKVHDIITVVVNEKAEVTLQSRYNRQRQASLKAELKEFIRIGEDGNLANAASNEPAIDATLNGRLQSSGQATDTEGIRYRIGATVVDIKPNGNLVLEAKKSFQQNDDLWEYSLTGTLRFEDVQPNNTALSENIANLQIKKRQRGRVFDSTKRPWGVKWYDRFFPF